MIRVFELNVYLNKIANISRFRSLVLEQKDADCSISRFSVLGTSEKDVGKQKLCTRTQER